MLHYLTLITTAVAFGTVIMFGAVGEIITEKSGNLNLGVPGIMYIGGIAGLAGVFIYQNAVMSALQNAYDAFLLSGGAAADFTPEGTLAFFTQFSNKSAIGGYGANGTIGIVIALLSAFICAGLAGLIYSFLTITLRANQNVTGLTLTIFGAGVANFFGGSLQQLSGGVGQVQVHTTSEVFRLNLLGVWNSITGGHAVVEDVASASDAAVESAASSSTSFLDVIGDLLFSYGWLVYLAIVVAVISQIFLTRTRKGLNLRAVGENPATADAAGINVTLYKYLATCIGAGISGLGGLYYVMDYTKGTWANDGTIETLGWLAVALVIFATWKPANAIWGSYLFGVLFWLWLYIAGLTRAAQEIFRMLPYVVTIVVLIFISLRKKPETQPPASLGLAYFREDR